MILLKGEQLILLNLVVEVSTWTNFFCLKSRDWSYGYSTAAASEKMELT